MVKNEKQDRRELCKDATVSIFSQFSMCNQINYTAQKKCSNRAIAVRVLSQNKRGLYRIVKI
jgi:hypothetical protein